MTDEQERTENFGEEGIAEDDDDDILGEQSAYQSDFMKGEEEEIEEEDAFSHLGESSDDPEQKRRYIEYLVLIKNIECQNKLIADIKAQISELCDKPCRSRAESKEVKRLHTCMEKENINLSCMITKAVQLQNFGSHRRYHDIPVETTMDEDNMNMYFNSAQAPPAKMWKSESGSEGSDSCQDEKEDKQKQLRNICKAMGKMKICCPEDKKLIKEIAQALMCKNKRRSPKKDPCADTADRPCPQPCASSRSEPCDSRHHSPSHKTKASKSFRDGSGGDSLNKLKQKIAGMQCSVQKLKQEIRQREDSRKQRSQEHVCEQDEDEKDDSAESHVCSEEPDAFVVMSPGKRNTKADQIAKLKENYLYLLGEYGKKEFKLKELEKRLKGTCGTCGGNGKGGTGRGGKPNEADNPEESELVLLRGRVNELKEEQVEFKCIMKEQSQQLEDYRNKYLVAQQKVEEQTVTLEKLNLNNKRIEKQINTEVKEIRAKFQEKLNELLHFPKLLENEQLKLASACKEKEELQGKLVIICKELKALKASVVENKEPPDCRPALAKCQLEFEQMKTKMDELERQRDLFCEQLKTTQDDLDTLRSESAKIIARTKERAEMMKQQQQELVNRLEKQLAQCRATACLSISDREAVIREMQGQLNTLSYSFDAAQKQIKTLRNHVAYVSNENCFPVKC